MFKKIVLLCFPLIILVLAHNSELITYADAVMAGSVILVIILAVGISYYMSTREEPKEKEKVIA